MKEQEKIERAISQVHATMHVPCLLETRELAILALEKQIPKKPKEYEDKYYACECGNVVMMKWEKYPTELKSKSDGLPYCLCCGQKLDWR